LKDNWIGKFPKELPAMQKLDWRTADQVTVSGMSLACAPGMNPQNNSRAGFSQVAGFRSASKPRVILKRVLWPVLSIWYALFGTGFILRGIGRMMRNYRQDADPFLEIGCGSMRLRKYLPTGCWYNAIDIAFSEFQLNRIKGESNINLALASATEIPLGNDSVRMVVSTEVFEHIVNIDAAMTEIRRIMKSGGKLLCSIPNNFYYKYQVVGENSDHVNKWTFDDFVTYMNKFGFRVLERHRIGYWIPIAHGPSLLTNMYLPIVPREEFYTSNFLYTFEITKDNSAS
jgi:SAM-dependent methyltransferase